MASRALNAIVAASVRRHRTELRWSARMLAERCAEVGMPSLTREVIAKIETGRRGIDMDEAAAFAAALRVPLEELTTEPVAPGLTVLHLSDLGMAPDSRFGRPLDGSALGPAALADRLVGDIESFGDAEHLRPDLVVISGDLGRTGRPREYDLVREFLQRLTERLGIGYDRVAVVPGERDVNLPATQAYFNECLADDKPRRAPYWSNWQRFSLLLDAWPDESSEMRMHAELPWSVFEIKDLRVVVAGLNSTVTDTPERGEHSGALGEEQAAWFADTLEAYERQGWLRIGLVHHNPRAGVAGTDGSLSDADRLSRVLGLRLNVLLHGHGSGDVDRLDAGTLALGAGSPADGEPNRYQLIRISPRGLTRAVRCYDADRQTWVTDGDVAVSMLDEQWDKTDGTFGFTTAQPGQRQVRNPVWQPSGAAWATGEIDEPSRVLDARQALLDRVADVCRAKNAGAIVQRIKARPPYLRVTYHEDGHTHQMRIGGCVGEFGRKEIDEFQAVVTFADPDTLILIHQGANPPQELRLYARSRNITLKSFVEFQGLVDLTGYVEAQAERLLNDQRYPVDGYVPHHFTDALEPASTPRADVVAEMLRQVCAPDGRFVLLLGDFGRGKTFALHELARRIPLADPGLVPMLIDLRLLDKAQSIEAHVAAHLAGQHDDIDMRALRYMLREGRIVLIFDGFDELVARATFERAGEHLQTLLSGMTGSAKIVVASRTQHFQTHDQILTAMGVKVRRLPERRILSLSNLTDDQIRTLLSRRYGDDDAAVDRRIRLLAEIPGLLELAQNPRMLTFIAQLDEDRLRAVADSGLQVSPAGLYHHILDQWLTHEANRTQGIPGMLLGFGRDELWTAVTTLALRMWESGELRVDVGELSEVARTLVDLAGNHLSQDQIAYTVGSGSLLVRTDEGMFGFIHESVREWLVANWIAGRLTENPHARLPQLERRELPSLTVDFLCGLAEVSLLRDWATRVTADPAGAGPLGSTNAGHILARIDLPGVLALRNASLRNEDLTNRAWPGADLTGADLSFARMTRMNLQESVLAGARLAHADLTGADLGGADLTEADLTGARLASSRLTGADLSGAQLIDARLLGTDLTGVIADGVQWRRAVLIGVKADAALLDRARAGGASVVPHERVEPAFRPPAIGVRFGFEEGRLPRPIAYDSDGALLAIGNEDGSILICDATDGSPLRTLVGHGWRTYVVAFSPRHPVLASGSQDGQVRLWDANTGRQLHVLGGIGWVWPMLFNTDGTLLAAGSKDGVVRIWNTATGTLRWELAGHTAPVWTATFDNQGRYLATADDNRRNRLWDLSTGRLLHDLQGDNQPTYWMRFDSAGARLAGGGHDGKVRLWSPETGELTHRLEGHQNSVYALDFHPNAKSLISADTGGSVRRWDLTQPVPTGRELGHHTGAVYRVTFSLDGELCATGDSDGTVRLWEGASGNQRFELSGHKASVWPLIFRRDRLQLATSSNDYTTKLWDTRTGQLLRTMRGHGRRVLVVSFSHDGRFLASSGNDGVVRLWDVGTGRCAATLRHEPDVLRNGIFSPTTDEVATTSNDGRIYLWDAEAAVQNERADEERVLDVATDTIWATAFSSDNQFVASANDDDVVQVMIKSTGRTRALLKGERNQGRTRALAFSPSGEELAAAGDDQRLRLWDWEAGTFRSFPVEHDDRIFSLAYSPDGSLVAGAGQDGLAVIWRVADGAVVHRIKYENTRLWTVVFDPAGEYVAVGGDEHTVDIWSVRTGKQVDRLTGHSRRVWSVAYRPDGRLIASGSTDGTVRLWRVGEGGRAEHAATLLGFPNGSVAITPEGHYKTDGDVTNEFWHVVGMARFEPGELDPYLPDLTQLEPDSQLF